jgi:hypothetical protein
MVMITVDDENFSGIHAVVGIRDSHHANQGLWLLPPQPDERVFENSLKRLRFTVRNEIDHTNLTTGEGTCSETG